MKRVFLACLIGPVIIFALIASLTFGFYTTQPTEQDMPTETVPAVTETPTEPFEFSEDWFDDALFIGDSRTVGLRAFKRLGEADYFCKSSMSTFTSLSWTTSDKRFYDENLKYVLSHFEYKKVFIELGINECGYDHELVIDAYQDLIDLIREHQPNAAIVVQSVITVSEQKASDKQFSLERITNLNNMIYEMAQENDLYYIDTNEFAADESGYLRSDLSNDGCHFHEVGSEAWNNFIVEKSTELAKHIS